MPSIVRIGCARVTPARDLRATTTREGNALSRYCDSRQTVAQVESGAFSDLGVRKVERMLSVLGLSLAVTEGPDENAPVRGAGSRLGRLLAGRALERRRRALALAARTLHALGKEGVSACIVGSLAKGTFPAGSDVDYLEEDRGGIPESRVMAIVEASMKGFAFDVTFADRADPKLLVMMLEEARRGTPADRRYPRPGMTLKRDLSGSR